MTPLIKTKSAYLRYKDSIEWKQNARRDLRETIMEARAERYTLQNIADILEITPQAVNQIIKKEK